MYPAQQSARRKLAWLGVSSAALLLSSCTQLALVTVNTAARFDEFSRQTHLAYGALPEQRLDLYLPRHPQGSPVVVFFFGGGWNSGDKASYKFVGAALANAGIIAVIPNYRLYPKAKFPAFLEDAASAVAWTHAHAHEWGGDSQQLFLVGHSAGAHIAVMLALDAEYLRHVGGTTQWIKGAVGLAGPYDFLPFTEDYLNDLFGPPAEYDRSQPINYVRSDAPPLLLMHGLSDTRVRPRNTQRLAAAVQAVGGQVQTQYFTEAGHTDLVAAFSVLRRHRLPVLVKIREFVAASASRVDRRP